MGLDTTHDCWHGPYSMFMRWRAHLHHLMHPGGQWGTDRRGLEEAWGQGVYGDQDVPINVLMAHSDCDGIIEADICESLASALQALVDKMPARGIYDVMKPATERFIAGLRLAAAAGEDVEFR